MKQFHADLNRINPKVNVFISNLNRFPSDLTMFISGPSALPGVSVILCSRLS